MLAYVLSFSSFVSSSFVRRSSLASHLPLNYLVKYNIAKDNVDWLASEVGFEPGGDLWLLYDVNDNTGI